MICDQIRLQIDSYFNKNLEGLSKEVENHLRHCQSCENYYQASILVAHATKILRKSEPVLEHPQKFTDNILSAVAESGATETLVISARNNNQIIQIAQRLLAAASVCLMLVFGLEQYIVVDKMNNLENKMGIIVTENPQFANNNSLLPGSQFFYQESLTLMTWAHLLQQNENSFIYRFLDAQINSENTEPEANQILSRVKGLLIYNSSAIFSQHIQKYKEAEDD